MLKKFLMMAIVAVTASLASPSASRAGFSIKIDNGASTITVSDGDALDLDTDPNSIQIVKTVGDYKVNITATTTSPTAVGGLHTLTDGLATLEKKTNSNPGASLKITLFSDGFSLGGPGGPETVLVTNKLSQSSFQQLGSVATGVSTISPPGGVSGTTPTATLIGGGNTATASTTTLVTISSNPFSLTNVFELSGLNVGSSFSGSISTTAEIATPVPSALILAAFGIPAFGLLRRRFASKVEATTAV